MSLMHNMQPEWSEAHAVLEMADLVRREGTRVYDCDASTQGVFRSMLCGLTITFQRGGIVKSLKALDLDIDVTLAEVPVANNDGIERNSAVKMCVALAYRKGNAASLMAWHRHLCAYRQSIRTFTNRDTANAR